MLHTKFQASKESGSLINLYIFFTVQTKESLGPGHFGPQDLHLNKLGKGH